MEAVHTHWSFLFILGTYAKFFPWSVEDFWEKLQEVGDFCRLHLENLEKSGNLFDKSSRDPVSLICKRGS